MDGCSSHVHCSQAKFKVKVNHERAKPGVKTTYEIHRHGFLFSFVAISSGNGHQVGRLVDVLTFFNCSQPIFGQWSIP